VGEAGLVPAAVLVGEAEQRTSPVFDSAVDGAPIRWGGEHHAGLSPQPGGQQVG
jgi:hypothetical protein